MTSKKSTTASTTAIPTIHFPATTPITIVKKEPLDITAATIINALACIEKQMEVVLNTGISAQAHASQPSSNGCHFCSETGHTMVHSNYAKLESFIN